MTPLERQVLLCSSWATTEPALILLVDTDRLSPGQVLTFEDLAPAVDAACTRDAAGNLPLPTGDLLATAQQAAIRLALMQERTDP